MKVCLIANPVSGRGKAARWTHFLEKELKARQHVVRLFFTTPNPQDLAQFTPDLAPDERVVVIGGDGTFNLVINHLHHPHPLIFLGLGTANVLRVEYRQPNKPRQVIDFLERGHLFPAPCGSINGSRKFAMMWSCGLDGAILASIHQKSKNRFGKLAIALRGVACLLSYPFYQAEIETDSDNAKGEFMLVSCINHYGGPFRVFGPKQTDKPLKIMSARISSRWQMLLFFLNLFMGRAARRAQNAIWSADWARIRCEQVPGQVDGDAFSCAELRIEPCPDPIFFLVLDKA
ncbi:MAG: hypothetical protein H6510_07945 [Acidobacteria bacterium]|nr:hypothetical protein [Acidobacteriota bacterium]MCB9397730.1 hypothetical protein [Acidobacteriota bacterium]